MKKRKSIKEQILNENKTCKYCGRTLNLKNSVISHIKPVSFKDRKVDLDENNIEVVCNLCNREKVHNSLKNNKWDYRTEEGIAKELNIAPREVRVALKELSSDVRKSVGLNKQGKSLYTLKSRTSLFEDYFNVFKKLSNDKLGGNNG